MKRVLLLLVLVVAAAACGDDGESSATTTTSESPDNTATSTTSSSAPLTSEPSEPAPDDGGAAGVGLSDEIIVFSGQGNDLVAYDDDGNRRLVIQNANDDPDGRDINGQICFLDDRTFIAGEDTGQPDVIPGWGVFDLEGETFEELTATQTGKFVPTYQPASSQPEMFGCGVLPDGRIVTTDVGNQASGDGTGQLMLWFPSVDGDASLCLVDTAITTAQQIAIDGADVLVASARPPTVGIRRYTDLPTSVDECEGSDANGTPVDTDAPGPTLFIDPADGDVGISNGIVATGTGGWYVSSVLTGRIAEYDADGTFVRTILAPPEGETLGPEPFSTGTPNGLAVSRDGSLWYADLGLVISDSGIGPGPGTGTVRVIRFVDGEPQPPETIDRDLRFPDALGVLPEGTR